MQETAATVRAQDGLAGPDANSRLTATTAVVLLVLLGVEGATLLSLRTFVSWHIFVGMLLVPVVGLKVGTTGYRFAAYYAGRAAYVRAGAPPTPLRLLGPIVVVSTLALFGTGVALAAAGPDTRYVLALHKASFVVWVAAMSIHVLAHVARLPSLARSGVGGGAGARASIVGAAVVSGAILAVATLPLLGPWEHWARVAGG